jgi:hypothetical protein
VPRSVKALWWAHIENRNIRELELSLSPEEMFTAVYRRGHWGKSRDPASRFYSGSGSHDVAVVGAYVEAIERWMAEQHEPLNAVDLGCGDFAVGSQIRGLFTGYTACDVVPELIEHNRQRFRSLDVDFRQLDICNDPLPPGDIVFIRQVLQHLSNYDVQKVLGKVKQNYRLLILTEHLPSSEQFRPNVDHKMGRGIRLSAGSGLVITDPPFSFVATSEKVLCEVLPCDENGGLIRTTLYKL